ncbi:MAG: GNAT family N-acetyltransferase [Anaerolineaceae bacterium]|nr:GNAT family N-acetyltransferase [Anaerolineaceae bacterium]
MQIEAQIELKEGFIVRPATMDDAEIVTNLLNACSQVMSGVNDHDVDETRTEWGSPDWKLEDSTRVVFAPNGDLAGYVEVWDNMPLPVNIWVWGRTHPDYEGEGVASYLMAWAEDRARQAVNRVPPDIRVAIGAGTPSTYAPAHRLLAGCGMEMKRSFYTMEIEFEGEVVQTRWPAGITVRSYDGTDGDFRAILAAVNESFTDHWGFVEQPLDQTVSRWQHFISSDPDFDPALWFIAMEGDNIAGMSLCYSKTTRDPQMGWVGTLGVRRPWRRKGVALALLHHSFAAFQGIGKQRAGLGVDASSLTGATRLYEKAGMHVARQFDRYEKVLRPGRDISTQSVDS